MSDESVIDRAVFDELLASTGGDMGFVDELIAAYLDDAPVLLATMRQALLANDVERFRRAAHSLKSSSASFGAAGLAGRAKELEMLARAGSLAGAGERLSALEDTYVQVCAELGRLQASAS